MATTRGAEAPTGTVALLFSDIEGSTQLLERAGDRYPELLAAHHRLLREVWAAHGGVEDGTEGDAFFVLFADPVAAIAAAAEAQRRLAAHAWPPRMTVRVRMGVHTGVVERREGNLWGADIHYAARLAAAAHGGQVLVSAATAKRAGPGAAPLGEHGLKDFAEPRPIFQLVIDGQGPEAFPPPRTLSRVATNLPAPADALIGRTAELDDLAARIVADRRRLLTLTGPGGSGKTRLAIALGRRLLGSFPDGVFFVALDELTEAAAVPAAIVRALELPDVPGVAALDRVTAHLAARHVLLVLDNVEHLLDAAVVARRIVEAAPGVQVVATSQAPLRVAGEEIVPVPRLAIPAAAETDLEVLARVPSVALLLDRARSAAPGFALTRDNAAAVQALCAFVDGLPLALELAAARFDVIAPDALVRRLDRTLDALGSGGHGRPGRQRGLRAMLDWTACLLAEPERRLLGSLSVFAGGFTLDLAELALGDVLDELASLRDVGLLRRDEDDRFSMAPPVRRYCAELLGTAEEQAAAQRRMARALAELAGRWEPAWFLHLIRSAPALNAEAANILAALGWSRAEDPRLHADLAAAAGWWLRYSGRVDAAREHLSAALATAAGDPVLTARVVEALGVGGPTAVDPDAPMRAAEIWGELGDRRRQVAALWNVANNHAHFGRGDAAARAAETGLALARDLGDPDLVVAMEVQRAGAAAASGRPDEALELIEPLRGHRGRDDAAGLLVALFLGDFELEAGRPAAALGSLGDALRALEPTGIPTLAIIEVDAITVALAQLGRTEDAATALALSELLHDQYAMPVIGVAEAYAALAASLPPETREAGRERARRIGAAGATAWFREVAVA